MRRTLPVVMLVAAAGLGPLALANQTETTGATDDSAFLGTWSGAWTGGSAGRWAAEGKVYRPGLDVVGGNCSPRAGRASCINVQYKIPQTLFKAILRLRRSADRVSRPLSSCVGETPAGHRPSSPPAS